MIITMQAMQYNTMIQYKLSVPTLNHSMYHTNRKQLKACAVHETYGYTDFAFVSMITSEGNEGMIGMPLYVKSAAKLGASIKQWTNIDTVMMVFGSTMLSGEHHTILTQAGWIMCYMSSIENPSSGASSRFLSTKMYSKLNVWSLAEYEAVVMVDSDMLCVRDPVPLFTDVYQHMKQFGYQVAAAEDVPKTRTFKCNYEISKFNAGLLVLHPNVTLLMSLKDAIHTLPHQHEQAEQGFLNIYFKDNMYPLQYRYNANMAAPLCDSDLWNAEYEKIVFVHYTVIKPWMYSESYLLWTWLSLMWSSPEFMYMLWEQAPMSHAQEDLYNI